MKLSFAMMLLWQKDHVYSFSMTNDRDPPKREDLGQRCERFARRVRAWARQLPTTMLLQDDVRQMIRSSGSVGANYIEANEAVTKKDAAFRLRISRKEAKESAFWLRLLDQCLPTTLDSERSLLYTEANELKCIFHSIIHKYYP